jgi:opacity protein-like surface antigen
MRWLGAVFGLAALWSGGACAGDGASLGADWNLRGRLLVETDFSARATQLSWPVMFQSTQWRLGAAQSTSLSRASMPATEAAARSFAPRLAAASAHASLGFQLAAVRADPDLAFQIGLAFEPETPSENPFGELQDQGFTSRAGRATARRAGSRSVTAVSQFAMIAGMSFDLAGQQTFDLGYRYVNFIGARPEAAHSGQMPTNFLRGRADGHEIRAGLRYVLR